MSAEAVKSAVTPPIEITLAKGWWWPQNSKKAHYMVGSRSLCGKWLSLGTPKLEDENHESLDNCAACKKKREKYYGQKP